MANQWETGGESGPMSVNSELHTQPARDLCGGSVCECQWQEERQADPSLMQQPLDVVGKSEVLGGAQEALGSSQRLCVPSWARYS